MKVVEFKKNKETFLRSFKPFVIDIQTHGNPIFYQAKPNLDHYLINASDGETYLNPNLMRNQMDGIIHYLKELGFEEGDYSETGAARTVILKPAQLLSLPTNQNAKA